MSVPRKVPPVDFSQFEKKKKNAVVLGGKTLPTDSRQKKHGINIFFADRGEKKRFLYGRRTYIYIL